MGIAELLLKNKLTEEDLKPQPTNGERIADLEGAVLDLGNEVSDDTDEVTRLDIIEGALLDIAEMLGE